MTLRTRTCQDDEKLYICTVKEEVMLRTYATNNCTCKEVPQQVDPVGPELDRESTLAQASLDTER